MTPPAHPGPHRRAGRPLEGGGLVERHLEAARVDRLALLAGERLPLLEAIGRAAVMRMAEEADEPEAVPYTITAKPFARPVTMTREAFEAATGERLPLPRRWSRRQQKRAQVRAALLERRLRRRAGHDARWERQKRAMHRWAERVAEEDCRCCPMCSGACDEVFQGAPCARRCDCDERDQDERRLDDFYDDNDELDYGEGWEGES